MANEGQRRDVNLILKSYPPESHQIHCPRPFGIIEPPSDEYMSNVEDSGKRETEWRLAEVRLAQPCEGDGGAG